MTLSHAPNPTSGYTMSNKGKYESRNPLKRALLGRFLRRVRFIVDAGDTDLILDVGTGEGLFWQETACSSSVIGVDVRQDALVEALGRGISPVRASALRLPFADSSFDLVLAMEILEHLPCPELAVQELRRIARERVIVTVPWEPWFSLAVLIGSGQHWRRLGREPEHINAFGPREIESLLRIAFPTVRVTFCAPWMIVEAFTW